MQVLYLNMRAAGNRILVVDSRDQRREPPAAAAVRKLAAEHEFDQMMWVLPAQDPADVAAYRVFNADGSEVEQCGNGVRCVAWMLAREGTESAPFRLASPAGQIEAQVLGGSEFTISMGAPKFEPAEIPFIADSASPTYSLDVEGGVLDVAVLSMGNPHCVLFVDDVENAGVAELGPRLEHHPRFPSGANVGFAAVRARDAMDLRVHERGVGETLACGTGACAAVVAAQRLQLVDDPVTVTLPGGRLVVSWRRDTVWLTGGAELVSEGSMDI